MDPVKKSGIRISSFMFSSYVSSTAIFLIGTWISVSHSLSSLYYLYKDYNISPTGESQ